ncbi:UV radiation resistance protein and autophagy-related subunit 14-domain-containing protein [Trametes gibbosa]|nr:UV radiation resistance protein and autophagy-related subunit 14-domain-containing protein [Trametes gibbosa]
MECPNCELSQRRFYCENCLRQHLLNYRSQTQHAAADRDAHIATAEKALTTVVGPARLRRAELKSREESVQEIWDGVNQVRTTNERLRERVQALRSTLATRRRTLAIATSTFLHPNTSTPSTSASPPYAPVSASPQAGRAIAASRPTSSMSSHSPTPSPSNALPRPLTSSSRPTSTSYFTSTSPQSARAPFSLTSTPPQSYSRPSVLAGGHVRAVSGSGSGSVPGSAPYSMPPPTRGADPLARQIEEMQAQMAALADTIARARSGLVQELVEVFSVVEVGGRPPLGGKAGTKGEWTIGGLVLPVPGDIRRYPPDHINAVLTHTIHFVTLLAFYLGVKLPFEIVWSRSSSPPNGPAKGSGLMGVGIPWIGAIRGGESGGWARWSTKQPLHVSSAPPPASSSSSSGSPPSSSARPPAPRASTTAPTLSHTRTPSLTASSTLADSHLASAPPPLPPTGASSPGGAFTTALAMLLYDVAFLAHTQAVDVPLAHAGDALGVLWAVCCSPELGRRSHAAAAAPAAPLAAPTPPAFALDFSHLLQATAATPARVRARGSSGREAAAAAGGARGVRGTREERIVEEEEDEGWDLLDGEFVE